MRACNFSIQFDEFNEVIPVRAERGNEVIDQLII